MNKRLYSKLILTALAALSNIAYAGPVDNLAIEKEILFSLDSDYYCFEQYKWIDIVKLTATNNSSQEVSFSKYDLPKVSDPNKHKYAIRETIHNNKFAWIKKVARPVVNLVQTTWSARWPLAGIGFSVLACRGFKNWGVTTEESLEIDGEVINPMPPIYGLWALWFAYEAVYKFNQADTKYRLYEPWMQSLKNERYTLQPGESVSMYAVIA